MQKSSACNVGPDAPVIRKPLQRWKSSSETMIQVSKGYGFPFHADAAFEADEAGNRAVASQSCNRKHGLRRSRSLGNIAMLASVQEEVMMSKGFASKPDCCSLDQYASKCEIFDVASAKKSSTIRWLH